MISHNHKCIFLHIPKTAGNHFTNLFLNYSQDSKFIRDKEIQDGNDRFSICGPITKFKHHKIDFYNSSLNLGNFIFFTFCKSEYKYFVFFFLNLSSLGYLFNCL